MEKRFQRHSATRREVGVKWKVQRGWRDNQHFGMLIGGVVVEHGVDQVAGGDLALDGD